MRVIEVVRVVNAGDCAQAQLLNQTILECRMSSLHTAFCCGGVGANDVYV